MTVPPTGDGAAAGGAGNAQARKPSKPSRSRISPLESKDKEKEKEKNAKPGATGDSLIGTTKSMNTILVQVSPRPSTRDSKDQGCTAEQHPETAGKLSIQ